MAKRRKRRKNNQKYNVILIAAGASMVLLIALLVAVILDSTGGIHFNFVTIYLQQLPDVILILGLLAILFFIYGYNHLEYYGYKASDIIVHNYWINCMGENNIFCTGIYPYGFHCIVFYLRCVFKPDVPVPTERIIVIPPYEHGYSFLFFLLLCMSIQPEKA